MNTQPDRNKDAPVMEPPVVDNAQDEPREPMIDESPPEGMPVLDGPMAAGQRLLSARYGLSPETALIISVAVVATAIGPVARIQDPFGNQLPLSFDFFVSEERRTTLAAALADAFSRLQRHVQQKLRWREASGVRHLRAVHQEALQKLEAVEKELMVPPKAPPPFLPPEMGFQSNLGGDEREQQIKQQLLQRRAALRADVAERWMDLRPYFIADDPGWETVLSLDEVSFDKTLTILSQGATVEELLTLSPRRLLEIGRLVQASRNGRSLARGTSVLLDPVLINLSVVPKPLLRRALRHPKILDAGLLDGLIVEAQEAGVNLDEFVNPTTDAQEWETTISDLFALRSQGGIAIYLLNADGLSALEHFRQWCRAAVTSRAALERLACVWPSLMLKLALALHLAAGRQASDEIDLALVEQAVEVMKVLATKQIRLLESLLKPSEDEVDDGVETMVNKLAALGGTSSKRDLFRTYDEQDYSILTPVLERAVESGAIIRDGKVLRLAAEPSNIVSVSASVGA